MKTNNEALIKDRAAGVLLHISSLPGKHGLGDLGKPAFEFVDFLKSSGFKYWQVLPIGPVSAVMGYSPYSSPSTFAGNTDFISIDSLRLNPGETNEPQETNEVKENTNSEEENNSEESSFADYELSKSYKEPIIYNYFKGSEHPEFETFCKKNTTWLDDFALFTALSDFLKTNDWRKWGDASQYNKKTIEEYNSKLKEQVNYIKFKQFLFFKQWFELKEYANSNGIQIVGDIPIYVVLEGADAWANKDIFQVDANMEPSNVAGVPPDYFSEDGQRWGNPLYKWLDKNNKLYEPTYEWWKKRVLHLSSMFDIVRIDHFRAFEAYWSVPAEEETAKNGKWVQGPGSDFFAKLQKECGRLPLIAEDLGIITQEVEQLRDEFNFPGMKIMQFAFDYNSNNYYLPHNIDNPNCILYTGTHDNNTTNGWFYEGDVSQDVQEYIMEYLDIDTFADMHLHIIKSALMTISKLVIIPMQDLLGYGAAYRMNTPGTVSSNWGWKLKSNEINSELIEKFLRTLKLYGRVS